MEVWVLSIRTSLPKVCNTSNDIKLSVLSFESFQKANETMRSKIKEFAFSKNSMFNGNGYIKHLNNYCKELKEYEEDETGEPGELTYKVLLSVQEGLKTAFSGVDAKFKIKNRRYSDYMIGVSVKKDSIQVYGTEDGPMNGYEPVLSTNIISMDIEQDYYLYIDDAFGQDVSSELYIDLKKIVVE